MPMKKYVGIAKTKPDSRTPLRFPPAMIAMNPSEISTLHVAERWHERHERRGPGRYRDRDGEDVVGEQRDAGDLRR